MTIFGITFSEAVMWLMIAGIMAILEAITMAYGSWAARCAQRSQQQSELL